MPTKPNIPPLEKISCWITALFFLPLFTQAQDSTRALSRDLDSAAQVETLVQEIQQEANEDQQEDDEKDPGVFLPNWLAEDDSVSVRHIGASARKSQQDDDAFWYANHSFKKEEPKQAKNRKSSSLLDHPAFQTILWIVAIAGFITFIVIFLSNSNVGIFRKSRIIRQEENNETDLDNIFAINYQLELDKAVSAGNYNLGVRLLFLRLLRNMSDRHIIDYKQDLTNFDYLMQLQPTRYYSDFFRLTRHYEYSWYGQFQLQQDNFGIIRKEFENFDRKLN